MRNALNIVFSTMLICFLFVNGVGAFVLLQILPGKVGTPDLEMPKLEGLSLSRAKYLIRLHQLKLERPVIYQADSKVLSGHVLAQKPLANFKIKTGRTIRLTVSSGEEMITVPNLLGMSPREAEQVLNEAGLRRGQVAAVHSYTFRKANVVMAQSPEPGTYKKRQSSVSILLSLGLKSFPFLMPNLEGLQLDQVRVILEENGLEIGQEDYQPDSKFGPGTIINHQPSVDTVVQTGQKVNLQISGTDKFESEASYFVEVVHVVSGISKQLEDNDLPEERLPKKYVQIIIDDQRGQKRIVNSNYWPGTVIRKPYKAVGSAMVRVYEDYELVREEILE